MNKTSSLFSQVISLIDRKKFQRSVDMHNAERHSKGFSCWDQLVSMLFCQLAQAKSLREISSGLQACEGKLQHLGLTQAPKRSTLSYANATRPWELYRSVFYMVLDVCRQVAPRHQFKFKNKLLSLDASTIDLCMSMYDWARFRKTKGAIKLHLLLDHDGCLPTFAHITDGKVHDVNVAKMLKLPKNSIVAMDRGYNDYDLFADWTEQEVWFVTRMKSNARYEVIESREPPAGSNIVSDEIIELESFYAQQSCPYPLRRVVVWDETKQDFIVLLTNHLKFSATTISRIYKERWQIELFFKAIKQNLKIKTFVGTTANAVHIQIWTALISILLLKFLQMYSKAQWSLSNLVALLRWNLFSYRDLWKWLERPFETYPHPPPCNQMKFNLDSSSAY